MNHKNNKYVNAVGCIAVVFAVFIISAIGFGLCMMIVTLCSKVAI